MPKQKSRTAGAARAPRVEEAEFATATRTQVERVPAVTEPMTAEVQPDFDIAPREPVSVGAWQNDQRITALWSARESRTSWVLTAGGSWKKLSAGNDSARLALTVLAAHAKLTQKPVDYREEPEGVIKELYVW